jgi:hypothetical protein
VPGKQQLIHALRLARIRSGTKDIDPTVKRFRYVTREPLAEAKEPER